MQIALLPLLVITALPQAAARPSSPSASAARSTMDEARLAVEGDSVARVRARWLRAMVRSPADPLPALGLASLARLTYNYTESDVRYRALERTGGTVGLHALVARAQSHLTRFQLDSANVLLERAIGIARAQRDSSAWAESLIGLARVRARSVGPDSISSLLTSALALAPRGETALQADLRCSQARMAALGSRPRGDTLIEAGLRIAEASRNQRMVGQCLLIRSAIHEMGGRPRAAMEAGQRGGEILGRARDYDLYAVAMQQLAYLSVSYSADFPFARRWADSAVASGQRSGNPLPVAFAQLNLAQLALRFGDVRASARYTDSATAAFRRLNDQFGLRVAVFHRANTAELSGRFIDAYNAYSLADSLNAAIGFTGARVTALFRLASVSRELGRLDEAESKLNEAVRLATAMRASGITNTDQHYERGMLALARREYTSAIREFEEFRSNLGNAAPHYHYDAQARIAEALTGLERFAAADSVLTEAEQTVERLRRIHSEREASVAVLESRRFDFDTDLGFATIVNRFAEAGQVASAFRIAEARRARHLWTTMMRRRALQAASPASPELRGARLLPEEIQAARVAELLPDSTALLEYVTGRGGEPSTLFVLTRRGVSAHSLPPADSLLSPVATFVSALESGSPARALARRLGTTLLGPLQATLPADVNRLIIIPDGPLYRLPFDAIELSDGRPALQRYEISLAPSARIAASSWLARNNATGNRVLAFGDPAFSRASGKARLPASAREARAVINGLPNARALLNERASEAALKQSNLRDVRVLHFATHAEVEDFGVLRSALSLAAGNGEDGRVGVEDIAALDLDADLVVLSGCRTAGGVVVTGEGVQGLVAPFLEAGSRAVVATQWQVGDRSIVPLMTRFYRELRAGRTAGAALRIAKLAARANGEPTSVWASVVLTGDARVRPFGRGVTAGQ